MALPILDLNDPNNWAKVYEVNLEAQPSPVPGSRYPIPKHAIAFTFDSLTLAVGASAIATKPTWNLAFWLDMRVNIPGIGTAEVETKFIRLGLNLVRFPSIADQYTCTARIPFWFSDMNFTIWQYTGAENDVLDLLDEIEGRLRSNASSPQSDVS